MLKKMMESSKETVTTEELKSLIFASEEMTSLSSTLQGVDHGEVSQNWLCSATSVPSLNSRTVGICRMEECTNLGEGAQEVKYFILILCPTNIKGIGNHNESREF